MKKLLTISLLMLMGLSAIAQTKQTYEYIVKDTHHLKMDVYYPERQHDSHACIIYLYGGGFIFGSREDTNQVNPPVRWAMKNGYVLVAMDYRLGLKGIENVSALAAVKMFENAINMAAEDLIDATSYILNHLLRKPQGDINPAYIITMGSSAGAITALQADYMLGNGFGNAAILPDTFRYAGVMSFSGGIFSNKGRVKYRVHPPAPTLFCHGTNDHLVNYKQMSFCNIGFFGSSSVVKRFKKYGYPFYFRRYEEMGHEVATSYSYTTDLMDDFMKHCVFNKEPILRDETYYNPALFKYRWKDYRLRDLKKLQ